MIIILITIIITIITISIEKFVPVILLSKITSIKGY